MRTGPIPPTSFSGSIVRGRWIETAVRCAAPILLAGAWLWLAAALELPPARPAAAADAVVGPPCNDAALSAALTAVQASGGGTITFDCGTATITFGSTKVIASAVTIDGGGVVTLSGAGAQRLFVVNAGASLTLRGLTASDGFASDDGGAIHNSGHLEIQDSILRENNTSASFSGGAILNLGVLTATDASFINNTGGNAGAIYTRFSTSRTTIRQSFFWNNRTTNLASGWGGAMLLWDGAPVTISDTQFLSNTARQGGALYSFAGPLSISGSQFLSNTAVAGPGGALFSDVAVSITSTRFVYNSALGGGGGVYANGMTLRGTEFLTNTAGNGSGGGAYAAGGVSLDGDLFQGNRCEAAFCLGGGVLAGSPLELVASGAQFVGNVATAAGGGVYAAGAVVLVGGLFRDNECANVTNDCHAGALYAGSTLALTGTTFISNTARTSSGAVLAAGAAVLDGGLFQGNRCLLGGCIGGALRAVGGLDAQGARFVSNSAGVAGAVQTANQDAAIVNGLFAGNQATGGRGAALWVTSGNATLLHNTIAGAALNSATAVFLSAGSVTALNNVVSLHAVAYDQAGGPVNENYTLFAAVASPYSGTVGGGANSFAGAAHFVNTAAGDYRLGADSHAIDAGTDAGIGVDAFGGARPHGDGFDIGFHEYIPPVWRALLALIIR